MLNVFQNNKLVNHMSQARILKRLFCRSKFESQRKTQDVKTYGKFQIQQKIQEVKN